MEPKKKRDVTQREGRKHGLTAIEWEIDLVWIHLSSSDLEEKNHTASSV